MILAVDFDGTLSLGQYPDAGPIIVGLVRFLRQRGEQGDKLILWTCRGGETLKKALMFCADHGLEFDAVNDNLPETIAKYGSNSRKISCDYYIDDRAIEAKRIEMLFNQANL